MAGRGIKRAAKFLLLTIGIIQKNCKFVGFEFESHPIYASQSSQYYR